MKDIRAKMFNRRASSRRSRSDEVMRSLSPGNGWKIIDIGAGGGHFTLLFAQAVGEGGRVYAVDIEDGFLRYIDERAAERGLKNVVTVKANEDGFFVPDDDIDLVFLRNVYHHLERPVEYFTKVGRSLGPNGRIAIIDYDGVSFSFHCMFGHTIRKEQVIDDLNRGGFELVISHDFIPDEAFLVFRKARSDIGYTKKVDVHAKS